jgi:antitoxin component of MazEF toxin-antitoxin module
MVFRSLISLVCMLTTATVKKWGNSLGIVIDSQTSKKIGLKEGQAVNIDITPIKPVSAFGKYPNLKPIERDRDREL